MKETDEEAEDIMCKNQMHLPKEKKKQQQSIDIEQATLEEIEEIASTCKGNTTSEVDTTSKSTVIEITDNFNDDVVKFMREKQKEHKERVFTNNGGKSSNTSPDSYCNETMGADVKLLEADASSNESNVKSINLGEESIEDSLAFTHEEEMLLHSVKNKTEEREVEEALILPIYQKVFFFSILH